MPDQAAGEEVRTGAAGEPEGVGVDPGPGPERPADQGTDRRRYAQRGHDPPGRARARAGVRPAAAAVSPPPPRRPPPPHQPPPERLPPGPPNAASHRGASNSPGAPAAASPRRTP